VITTRDIYDALLQYYDNDRIQALSDFNDLKRRLLTEPINVRLEMNSIYLRETQENNICPKHLTYMESTTIPLNKIEFQGREVEEFGEQMVCPVCKFHF
jgi:hypothetical protein